MSSSSSEQENSYTFRSADLPLISLPSSHSSSSNSSESDTPPLFTPSNTLAFTMPGPQIDSATELSTSIEPPTESPSSPTELGSTFSRVELCSQTSADNADLSSSNTSGVGKRRIHKTNTGRFQKGVGIKRKTPVTPTIRKRSSVSKPKSVLFQKVKFPRPNPRFSIKVRKDDTISVRDLLVPHGSQILDMEVLSSVFALLRCTEPNCTGPLRLYQYSCRDGLQSYLLLKCTYCHLVVAEFPTSLPIGMKPNESVNDPRMLCHKKSEVNVRALLAVHCTSNSWADFLLTCNILGLENSWYHMHKAPLSRLVQSSDKVCQLSMSLTADRVRASAETSHIPNVRNCTVSFDATWHQRGYYSNQGFAAAIEVGSGKVLDYVLYDRNCNKCIKWSEERKEKNPDEFNHYWESHSSQCPANFKGTSQAMESSAALEIWSRSVEKHSLAYTTYVGDGDSKSFKRLCDDDPYNGKEIVRKEECLGHTQKRLKKHLTKAPMNTLTSK